MYGAVSQIFYPATLQEFFNALNRTAGADIFAGSARQTPDRGALTLAVPGIIVSADNIAELRGIYRTERFIDMGPMVKLHQILRLGKIVPEALRQTLDILYTALQRGILSIGGEICREQPFEPFAAALTALGVRCELRTNTQSRWINALRLTGPGKAGVFFPEEILYRIRIPLEQWNFTLCRRFDPGSEAAARNESAMVVFLARIQNDILSDVRIVFSGASVIRNNNRETALIGQKLPLPKKDAAAFASLWGSCLEEACPPFLQARVVAFIENVMRRFSD
ncbi:MAG: FAD binding domain-containing protein [Spirochaetaceae bacterium]|jgi:CO/xanthine dehydrogenase FAD-binding subunit|nr:FAD binding domain-containing protein [Spirochaetaceae bacterium]